MMEIVFAVAAVVLLSAPIAFAGAAFVDRPFGFGSWRGDPWPVGMQEEDPDHAWGSLEPEEAPVPTRRQHPEATVEDVASLAADERPDVAAIRPSVRRAA